MVRNVSWMTKNHEQALRAERSGRLWSGITSARAEFELMLRDRAALTFRTEKGPLGNRTFELVALSDDLTVLGTWIGGRIGGEQAP